MGHQRVEERHGEGQDQQDAFPLPTAARQGSVLLLNLASRRLDERDRLQPSALGLAVLAVGSAPPRPAVSTNAGSRREVQQGCPCLLRLRCPPGQPGEPCLFPARQAGRAAVRRGGCAYRVHVLREVVHGHHAAQHRAQRKDPGQEKDSDAPQSLAEAQGAGAGPPLGQQLLEDSSASGAAEQPGAAENMFQVHPWCENLSGWDPEGAGQSQGAHDAAGPPRAAGS